MLGKDAKEVTGGRVANPIDLTGEITQALPLAPRYAIIEQHGARSKKIRLSDDFRASAANAIIATGRANSPGDLEVFAAIAAYTATIAMGCDFKCLTLDFPHAYKHVPIREWISNPLMFRMDDPSPPPSMPSLLVIKLFRAGANPLRCF